MKKKTELAMKWKVKGTQQRNWDAMELVKVVSNRLKMERARGQFFGRSSSS